MRILQNISTGGEILKDKLWDLNNDHIPCLMLIFLPLFLAISPR